MTAEPTPDVYSQIISMIENIEISGVTDEQIENAVAKYLLENPIDTITESDVQRIVAEYVAAHKEEFKGEKGDKGDTGASGRDGANGADRKDGANGADGYTPVKGTDYWTSGDILEIQSYIDSQIGGALNGSY